MKRVECVEGGRYERQSWKAIHLLESHVPVNTTHRQTDLGQGEQPLWLLLLTARDFLADLGREKRGPQWRRETGGQRIHGEHRSSKTPLQLHQCCRERPPAT